MCKNIVQPGRPQMTTRRMCIEYWIPKATDTHSEFVILIAFHCNNACTNAPQYHVIRTLPVLLGYDIVQSGWWVQKVQSNVLSPSSGWKILWDHTVSQPRRPEYDTFTTKTSDRVTYYLTTCCTASHFRVFQTSVNGLRRTLALCEETVWVLTATWPIWHRTAT